jgi:hypothetical protein
MRRVDVGQVRTDVDLTMQDAELRAQLADKTIQGRELQHERTLERQAEAEDERRRADRERADRDAQAQREAEALREHANAVAELSEPELHI